jgi:hypothetical protein
MDSLQGHVQSFFTRYAHNITTVCKALQNWLFDWIFIKKFVKMSSQLEICSL